MELELEFFQAALKDGEQPEIGLLVLDFDETLSVSDTTSVIINTAIMQGNLFPNGEPIGILSIIIQGSRVHACHAVMA